MIDFSTTLHTAAVLLSGLMVVHSLFMNRAATQQEEKDGWCMATVAWACVVLLEIFHHVT